MSPGWCRRYVEWLALLLDVLKKKKRWCCSHTFFNVKTWYRTETILTILYNNYRIIIVYNNRIFVFCKSTELIFASAFFRILDNFVTKTQIFIWTKLTNLIKMPINLICRSRTRKGILKSFIQNISWKPRVLE